jgi:hypothetical protein
MKKWDVVGFSSVCQVVVGEGGLVSGLLLCGSNKNYLLLTTWNCKMCELMKGL